MLCKKLKKNSSICKKKSSKLAKNVEKKTPAILSKKCNFYPFLTKLFIPQLLFSIFPFFISPRILAQTSIVSTSCESNLEYLNWTSEQLAQSQIVTAKTISTTGLTIPSLWWAKRQFDPFEGKLVTNWLAFPNENRIDLIVNPQLWSVLNYIQRYTFVNRFGTVAREYQYNLRVFDEQKQCLAIYSCNFSTTPDRCQIDFDLSIDNGLTNNNK